MRDTSAKCDCCGKREQAGQCVKGSVMCSCETYSWRELGLQVAYECPKCKQCPVHCGCFDNECNCKLSRESLALLGHYSTCPARIKSREQHTNTCVHEFEWEGGHGTPYGPTEPELVCKNCGAVSQED